jgi:hypothetical protein
MSWMGDGVRSDLRDSPETSRILESTGTARSASLSGPSSPAAGVVPGTMLAPVLLVPRRYVKVNRRCRNELRRLLDHHGLRIDQLRLKKIADIDLAEESGLADSDPLISRRGICT